MDILRLPAEEAAVHRVMEKLWIPYMQELGTIVEDFALSDSIDPPGDELAYQLDRLEQQNTRGWVAVDGSHCEGNLGESDAELVGFVITEIDECPSCFERPDRLTISDIYVRESARGTGLAQRLVEQSITWAREIGCDELTLAVDVENTRAIAFYEKLGFEVSELTMSANVTKVTESSTNQNISDQS